MCEKINKLPNTIHQNDQKGKICTQKRSYRNITM